MRLHATVSKDGHKLRTRLHPSRRIPVGKSRLECSSESDSEYVFDISGSCEATGKDADAGDQDPGFRAGDRCLEVFGEPTIAAEPGKGSLDHPTSTLWLERSEALGTGDDLDRPFAQVSERGEQLRTSIYAVGEDVAQLGEHASDDPQQRYRAMVVLHIAGLHKHRQQRTLRIGDDMTLAAHDPLGHVKPARAATFRGLHSLAVDNAGRRTGLAPLPFAHLSNQSITDRAPQPRSTPFVEVIANGRTWQKILRQRAPLASRRRDVEDRVHDRSQIDLAWPAASTRRRHKPLHQSPLLIRRVACIAQPIAPILLPGDFSPRHFDLNRISQIRRNHKGLKSLNFFSDQALRMRTESFSQYARPFCTACGTGLRQIFGRVRTAPPSR